MLTFSIRQLVPPSQEPKNSHPSNSNLSSKFKITSNLDYLALSLNDEGKIFARLSVSNSNLLIEVEKGNTKVTGILGNISIRDATPEGSKHSQILSINEKQLIQFYFESFHPPSNSKYDSLLSMFIFFLHFFFFFLR